MLRYRTDKMLFVDLELTCDEPQPSDWTPEIIQLGIVELDTASLEITRRASYLVRPRNWVGITPFCTALTGIFVEQVKAKGRPWPEVVRTFTKTFGPGAKTVVGWGRDDDDIAVACEAYGIDNPIMGGGGSYLNVASTFRMLIGSDRSGKMGLAEAMVALDLEWPGRQHDALVDAEATSMVWIAMAKAMRGARCDVSGSETPC